MRNLIILILTICIGFICKAQTSNTEYYKDGRLTKLAEKDQAKYSKTIHQNIDGSITTEIRKIKTGNVIESYTYKGNIPYGIWKLRQNTGLKELDYNFDLSYEGKICEDSIQGIGQYKIFEDNEQLGYQAPRLLGSPIPFFEFLRNEITYPRDAIINRISGTVFVLISIDDKGVADNISINKGTNIYLDKEAVRALKKLLFFTSPAYKNGKAIRVCSIIPIGFSFQ